MMDLLVPVLLGLAFLIAVVVCAFMGAIAWSRSGHLTKELDSLKRDVAQLMGAPRDTSAPQQATAPRRGCWTGRTMRPPTASPRSQFLVSCPANNAHNLRVLFARSSCA